MFFATNNQYPLSIVSTDIWILGAKILNLMKWKRTLEIRRAVADAVVNVFGFQSRIHRFVFAQLRSHFVWFSFCQESVKNNRLRFCFSGIFPLMKTGAPQMDGACVHVQLKVVKYGSSSPHWQKDKVRLPLSILTTLKTKWFTIVCCTACIPVSADSVPCAR